MGIVGGGGRRFRSCHYFEASRGASKCCGGMTTLKLEYDVEGVDDTLEHLLVRS
jgi:hypothetical protein